MVHIATDTGDLVEMIGRMGFHVYEDFGPGPSCAHICVNGTDDYPAVVLAVDFNREDHGWEAAYDTGGDQEGLTDGPGPGALVEVVAHWATDLARDPQAHRA